MHNPNNVQVGSQVRFLNTVGGGRVARITADTAWVEDADGFEIPTPLKDCVVVEAGDTFIPEIRPPKIIQEKLRQGRTEPAAPAPSEVRRPVAPAPRPARPLRAGEDELTVQLAFLPQDRAKLGLTNYEAYLVNYSGFTLYYVYLSAVGTGYKVRSTGTIEPHSDAFLEEFAPADLNDLEQLALSYPGVVKTYAIQAGRELRVIVGAENTDDSSIATLSAEIAKRIQDEMTYPGQVKITVIRETRSVSYAK